MADGGPAAVFDRAGEGFVATPAARGPWAPGEAHGGAPSALLARAVERVEPAEGMAVARLTVDFLGAVPLGAPLAVAAAVVKPGRRFQLVEAELSSAGRVLCRARAVRLRRGAGPVSPGTEPGPVRPPDPHEGWEWDALVPVDGQDMFFPTAVEVRVVNGAPGTGAASAWFRLRLPLVGGESPSPLQRTAAAADFGNGISWALDPRAWLFVNTELTVHLAREPAGDWIALAARTDFGDAGAGVATATLFDARGRVGVSSQALYVARRD